MMLVVVICLGIQAAYYLLIFTRLAIYKENPISEKGGLSSILICYKNEEQNIDRNLPSILEQDYVEVVLVNDMSTDHTLEKLKKHSTGKIKVISTEQITKGKKEALLIGITAVENNSILLTDADCIPATKKWSRHMSDHKAAFVLGYGPMQKLKGAVSLFSRYETYMTALQYLSYALAGMPYMGVGRNMKIDKTIVMGQLDNIQGSHLASGDDDLMINALSTKDNTSICINPESFVYSAPKTNLYSFLRQKSRHISTSPFYKPLHQLLLSTFSVSQILFYLALIFCLITGSVSIKLGFVFLIGKWAIQQVVNYKVMKKLNEKDLFWKFPILDLLFFVYLLVMPVYYLFNKNKSTWS